MRILLLNTNSSSEVTKRIKLAAEKYNHGGLEIITATAKNAPPAIETSLDELKAANEVIEELTLRKGL